MARKIQRDLECIRGVRFTGDVGVEFQSLEDFEAFLERELAREMEGGKDLRQQRLLHALGLMDPEVELLEVLRTATLEQAAAYYDPETDTFYVVQSMPAIALKAVMAHELQHALQDQHTALLDRYTAGDFDTLDAELAVRFLVEGEATLVGNAWALAHIADDSLLFRQLLPSVCHLPGERSDDPGEFWSTLRDSLVSAAEQTRAEIEDPGLLAKIATRAMSTSMYESLQGLRDLPNFVFYSLLMPYNRGALTVHSVLVRGGHDWSAVDALFAAPPETTEQVLHPAKLGGTRREGFRQLPLPRASATGTHTLGWTFDPDDRVGELGIRIFFIERGLGELQAARLAEGWDGDRVRVWWRDDDDTRRLAFEWRLAWDDVTAATRFRVAYASTLTRRYPELIWAEGAEGSAADRAQTRGSARYQWTDAGGVVRHGELRWSEREILIQQGWTELVATP